MPSPDYLSKAAMAPSTHTSSPVYLPNELVSDILSRIPEKSVCRFRCMSKEWCALISDPAFVTAHKSHNEPFLVVASLSHPGLQLVDMDGNVVRVMSDAHWFWRPVSTSPDDMVCVTGYRGAIAVAGVIDLATMKLLVTGLGGDKAWGFGRAVPSGAYKMVLFLDHTNCEVITIGDGAGWRPRKSRPSSYKGHSLENCVATVNGTLYLAKERQDKGDVLCFDLESEEWKNNIKGPPKVTTWCHRITLGELNGALCMAEPKNWGSNQGCNNIWLLTDSDKSIWVKSYRIPSTPSTLADSPMSWWVVPLRVLHDHDGSKLLFYYSAGSVGTWLGTLPVLQIYDPRDGTCTNVTKKLLNDHGNVVGFCNLHLARSTSAKVQRPISSMHFI